MLEMMPFKRNNLSRRDDFLSPFFKNFFEDDFFTAITHMNHNFKVDLKETNDSYLVEADLPGVKKEAINIDFENNYLTISAKRDETIQNQSENYVRRERHYGEFKRSFHLDNIDENKIDASFTDGVLKITLPKLTKDIDKKRRIDIH